ncbi:MAG: DUF599 domain-containing protein [Alphaproteobacteria bacterium]|nr:DUF599 domain-containing protein [Alphaproteobacteria bacterium]MBU2270670.1 DUF599 domain-containing protein [Alphaproteobacteria bacterium]MBU2365054.1 DUF599 domain-containing protein [Alphaproteobacteria bacterium]
MTISNGLALGLFFLCWLGYGPLLAVLARRVGSLNDDMIIVRRAWMRVMTHREVRIVDSQLMGHTINSGGFFASTNLLLIAAVASVLFGGEQALQGFASVGAEAVPVRVLEAKLALVLVCLARGLLDFIWSIRQLNYALALIGAAPEVHTEADRVALGEAAANLLNPALSAFSQGVRGYYFALAASAWLFGPHWLALGVAVVFCLLVWRQVGSPAARAVRATRRLLEPHLTQR